MVLVVASFTVIKFDITDDDVEDGAADEEDCEITFFLIILFTSLLILTDCFIDCWFTIVLPGLLMIWFVAAFAADWDTPVWGVFELLGLVVVLLLLELLLDALPLLPLPDVVGGGGVLPLLLLLPLSPVSVLPPLLLSLLPDVVVDDLVLPPLLPPSVLPASWLDGIIDGSDVLLLLSDVVGGEGGGVLLLSLLPLSLLLLLSSGVVDGGGVVVLPASLLLSPTALEGVDASVVVSSDLCLFFVPLASSEMIAGGHFPFTGIEPSGHSRAKGLMVPLLTSLLPLPSVVSSLDAGGGGGEGVLLLSLVDGVDAASPVVVLSSDLLFFAAKTVSDPSKVKAIVVTEETRIKMVDIDITWEFCIVFVASYYQFCTLTFRLFFLLFAYYVMLLWTW
jgi:hypothetical protein